jgi:hypothetical protein
MAPTPRRATVARVGLAFAPASTAAAGPHAASIRAVLPSARDRDNSRRAGLLASVTAACKRPPVGAFSVAVRTAK